MTIIVKVGNTLCADTGSLRDTLCTPYEKIVELSVCVAGERASCIVASSGDIDGIQMFHKLLVETPIEKLDTWVLQDITLNCEAIIGVIIPRTATAEEEVRWFHVTFYDNYFNRGVVTPIDSHHFAIGELSAVKGAYAIDSYRSHIAHTEKDETRAYREVMALAATNNHVILSDGVQSASPTRSSSCIPSFMWETKHTR